MTEKMMAYQKCFIGPLVWKCLTNDFELLLSEKLKFENVCPGEVRVRQNDMEKLWRTKRFLLAHWFGNVPQMILSYF